MTGLLFSSAIALVTYGATESLEATAVILVLAGILFKVMRGGREGFKSVGGSKVAAKRPTRSKKSGFISGPTGVLSSTFAEGFEDAKMPEDEADEKEEPEEGFEDGEKKVTDASGVPTTADLMGLIKGAVEDSKAAGAATSKPASTKEAFRNDPKGLFKLGEIPTDEAGGYHIDQGTTVLNALNALKPDQIKAMTSDTQQLIETQKSLMGLLGTMKPMMQDGKQLLETFNTMFK